ncbi:spondin domain-containing protein [uncultured Roseobacter sp.]|uniref:spondin domain-containing protein n=1 Tax=uncultured Roseobacter sp. TaxID=114847 RepID=UPI00260A1229|nr:spondin domain-containing protein [uncultured Roseobacter sp.]
MTKKLLTGFLAVLVLIAGTGNAAAQDVIYDVRVILNWSEDTALNPPTDAHWSRLIAFAHSKRYSLFTDGDTASSGLALVATNGRTNVLEAELSEASRRNRARAPVVLPGTPGGRAEFVFELALSERFHRVSFATMLAPSPDWFSGISGVSLRNETEWFDELSHPLWVWDAGADGGPDYNSANDPTQPRQSVRLLAHPDFLRASGLQPVGEVVFTRRP